MDRRNFLTQTLGTLGALSLGPGLTSMVQAQPLIEYASLKKMGPLLAPNAFGMRLPAGFSGRLLAQSKQKVKRYDGKEIPYVWHTYPDGGACFATDDGGWIYTSNSEVALGQGGAGAMRFDAKARLIDAYSILNGTTNNCAGGPTPWSTWLSCEEFAFGSVFECDIYGKNKAVKCRGLGSFQHEAVAVDPVRRQIYLTEDMPDGRFYRFTPKNIGADGRMNLQEGILEAAAVDDKGLVRWLPLKNPNPGLSEVPTRLQIPATKAFNGGEGIWHHEGIIYLTTKGDNRVWSYVIATGLLTVFYDQKTAAQPILSGVDNVTVSRDGHVLVAEDGGHMQIVVLGPHGDIYPLMQLVNQDYSEITGPALNPGGNRLYFSSQRGLDPAAAHGATYEVIGNFA